MISLIINYEHDRVLALQGPRGAGKSSLISYIDAALRNSQLLHPPVFVRFDGLQLVGDYARAIDPAIFDRDCPQLLAAAVNDVLDTLGEPLRSALDHCEKRLRDGTNCVGADLTNVEVAASTLSYTTIRDTTSKPHSPASRAAPR